MDSIFVRAKLHRQVSQPHTVPRPHLLQRLSDGLYGKLTLVSAPAGFGKSTLVNGWLDEIEATTDAYKISWLSLEESDNYLPHFVRFLVAAIEVHYPQSCPSVLALLFEQKAAAIEILVDVLVNDLIQLPDKLIVVLDDLHNINDSAIFAFLARLIQISSNQLHLVVITRVDPPLPLNRWRAQGLMQELRIHDLAFTRAETAAFLAANLATLPTPEELDTLHELTEGWVVGLRLAALALRGLSDYTAVIAGFKANSNRYIIDYLVDDVLDQLQPAVQQFLSGTAILTYFCPALCAAILEIDEATAREHISYMARANLFLIELSSPPRWYRYHHQFQSMLLSRLHERYDQQAIARMHRLAAAWLAAHGYIEEALRHLTAIADHEAAADLIEAQRVAAMNDHRYHDLDKWSAMLPSQIVNQRPGLLINVAWIQNYWLNDAASLAATQRAKGLLNEHAATLPESTRKLLQAELDLLQVAQDPPADRAAMLALLLHHWEQIRPYLADTHWGTVVWLAHYAHFTGGGEAALDMLLTAFEQATEWSPMARSRLLYSAGILYWYNCNLAEAERVFQQSLYVARQHDLAVATMLGNFGLALVATERNQYDQAEGIFLDIIEEPQFQNGLRAVIGCYHLILHYAAQGEPDAGRSLVEELKSHALRMGRPYLITQVEALEALLALVNGDLAGALRWALASSRGKVYRPEDRIPLIRVQILAAEGSPTSLHMANKILQEMIHLHEREHRWSLWIETLILEALTWAKLGNRDLALAALGKAVLRAVPNGVVGPFVVRGAALQSLLHELGEQAKYAQLVQVLWAAFPPAAGSLAGPARNEPSHAMLHASQYDAVTAPLAGSMVGPMGTPLTEPMVEPLTEREQDVLRLLVGRLSNKEIAHRLIVSPHTVRNHTANIFGKLQVTNRVQAVARARSLGILPPTD